MVIEAGNKYRHTEGLTYRVDDISVMNATHYEMGVEPIPYVLYTQLEPGSYPVGQQWVREKEDFTNNFTLVEAE